MSPELEPTARVPQSAIRSRLYSPLMSLALRFLGTSASRPTVERNVSSLAIVREGETLLFDCGEGTQRQMMRYDVGFSLADVFFTHLHADHILGIIGLLRTMALQGRTEPIRLWGPAGAARMLRRAAELGADRVGFPVERSELRPGERVQRAGYAIVPFAADHGPADALGGRGAQWSSPATRARARRRSRRRAVPTCWCTRPRSRRRRRSARARPDT